MRYVASGDACLSIFGLVYDTGALVFPPGASVLEIGCAEADWITPMLALRPDLSIAGIDWRPAGHAASIIRGDVLTHEFPDQSFDAIVGISSLEHIGLGHYDGDPLDEDGDVHVGARIARWLKPGGWLYADVPYQASGYHVHGTSHRAYDLSALQGRLVAPGMTARRFWFTDSAGEALDDAPTATSYYVAVLATKD